MAIAPDTAEFVIAKVEAQRNATLIQIGALLAAGLCIALAAALQKPINTQRKDLQLVLQSNIYKELPPEYAWVSAAGGAFRGLAADILWMRADRLKEEGKYYEAHQLAKWICVLYPRFPSVWVFQAWNMSYNISVATHTAQERWQWVYNGIRLLRDEGIPNNERVVPLYHQLAWIWFHKVGDRMDDFHGAYKRVWAGTMDILLGAPPGGATRKQAIDWFRPVAEAPRTLAGLIAAHPGVAPMIDSLAAMGIDVNAGTSSQRIYHPLEETFFRKHKKYLLTQTVAGFRKESAQPKDQDPLFAFLRQANPSDLDALLAYLRAKVLREQYKMDPQFMLAMSSQFGTDEPLPIDWRTPWSQAMYWAMYGTHRGTEAKNVKEFDILNTDRIMLFSLATLAKTGRLVLRTDPDDPMNSFLNFTPDLRYVEAMHKKYLELGKKHAEEDEKVGDTAGETLRSGHVNNLQSAIVAFYLSGQVDEARKYLDYLAVNYKDLFRGTTQEQYLQSLDEFVRSQLSEMVDSYTEAAYLIYSLLNSGYIALAAGNADEFTASVRNAVLVYEMYQKDKIDDPQGRRQLPPFARMRADGLAGYVLNYEYPLIDRSLVWTREQLEIRQQCFDDVAGFLEQQCDQEGLDPAKAFPPPAGMEQWRKDHPKPQQPGDAAKKPKEAPKS